jgi:hypothetical protein
MGLSPSDRDINVGCFPGPLQVRLQNGKVTRTRYHATGSVPMGRSKDTSSCSFIHDDRNG